jgi:hypothetical protein
MMHDFYRIQKPGKNFSLKTAFLDTLIYSLYCLQLGGAKPPPLGGSFSRFSLDFGA